MSGTVREAATELWQIYRLPVVAIPPNRPCIRVQLPDRSFALAESKWQAVVEEIAEVHRLGRPVLVGTRSVAASEALAHRLGGRGLICQVLNAVRHAEEATIVAQAGESGRITIATNMAGRGTDIMLGKGSAAAGGLHVIATEANESGRVDRQLFGRAGRQGSPGSARLFTSMEDDLLRRFLPAVIRRQTVRLMRQGQTENLAGPARGAVRYAQFAAQWLAARQRAGVLRNDTWLEEALSFSGPNTGG
jgi:preprotein translocase subunit SecA